MFKAIFLAVFVCSWASASQAMPVVNGDFSNNLTGWTTESFSFSPDPVSPSLFIQTTGTDPYAQLQSPFATSGFFLARLSQEITITAQNALFSFDLGLVSQIEDISDPTPGSTVDNLAVGFELDNARTFLTNLRADTGLTLFTANAPGTFVQSAAENGALSSRVTIDLSFLIGETISILFQTGAGDDGLLSNFGVDNVRLEQTGPVVAAVPVPMPLLLLLTGILSLIGFRKSKNKQI